MSQTVPDRQPYGPSFALYCFAAFASPFSIAIMQSALGLAALIWLVTRIRKGGSSGERLPLSVPVALLIGATAISGIFALDHDLALDELGDAAFPLTILLVTAVLTSRARCVTLGISFGAGATAAATTGLVREWGAWRVDETFRLQGTLSHYMSFAGLLSLGALVALSLALFAADRRHVLAGSLALIPICGALLVTQTRSAWIGLVAGSLFLAWRRDRRFVIVLPALFVLGFFVAPPPVQRRITSMADLSDATWMHRIDMWQAGVNVFKDHPLTGVGTGNLRPVYPDYEDTSAYKPDDAPFTHLHNNVVQIAAERGILGISAWFALWIAFFVRMLAACWRRPADWIVLASTSAQIGFLAAGMFEYNYGDSEVVTAAYILMALGLGAMRSETAQIKPETNTPGATPA